MHIFTVIKIKNLVLVNKNVFKRDLDDDNDGAHLISFGIVFQRDEQREKEQSQSVALLIKKRHHV